MNILIPHQWLLDHLETEASPQEIQKQLSLSGPSVERIYQRGGDQVYDIEITTNRVDAMSVHGVAREAAVILIQAGIKARLKPLNLPQPAELQPQIKTELPLPKINNDPQLCNRILTVILADVDHTPTPEWMARRLQQVDLQVHNSVIDITNYITHDLGHPCHAFDYDKLMTLGGEINVVEAKPNQEFITLEGKKYTTAGGEIVFENQQGKIIDLPAIIGTKNSSVDADTRNILLWIENLDAQKVRQASMSHAIRTVAAQLNEKRVDPQSGLPVLIKGVQLYQSLTGAKIASSIYDEFPHQNLPQPVAVKMATINQYLGIKLDSAKIRQILVDLGCKVEVGQKQAETAGSQNQKQVDQQPNQHSNASAQNSSTQILSIQPPSFRPDLQIPADIVEEVARIYGYHRLPSQLMTGSIPTKAPHSTNFQLENRIKHFLANIGWQEVYTYSAVSSDLAQQTRYSLDEHLALINPLTDDHVYLRRSLIPSLVEAVEQNPQRDQLSMFELASIYLPRTDQIPGQPLKLCLVSKKDYQQVRGDLEALLHQFYISQLKVDQVKADSDRLKLIDVVQAGTLTAVVQKPATTTAGEKLTETSVDLGLIYILKSSHIAVEIDIAQLLSAARRYPHYQPTAKTSLIIEDLTFTLNPEIKIGTVLETLDGHEWVQRVELKNRYQQNYTFSLYYQDPKQNLSSDDLAPIREALVKQVSQLGGKLVGEV